MRSTWVRDIAYFQTALDKVITYQWLAWLGIPNPLALIKGSKYNILPSKVEEMALMSAVQLALGA
jgi:hypothetical protein